MKISSHRKATILFGLAVLGIVYFGHNEKSSRAQTRELLSSNVPPATPPFIVRDTSSDSPGTNIVTRIVTITAEVDGSQPIARQWKVNKGHGFVTIPGATNASFRIGNAQATDSGFYSLFATNSAGHTNTTPVPLIVIDGED